MEGKSTPSARDRFEHLFAFATEFKQDGFRLANENEYAEVMRSIEDHKYLTNERIPFEISMDQAVFSWYENVYHPIMQAIDEAGLVFAFPDTSKAQLFMQVTSHWHFLKQEGGQDISATAAAYSYGDRFGSGIFSRLLTRMKLLVA